jgi:SWI/SNF-related matrix-associated actin-dependent regulator of chromatin subfamily A3
MEQAEKFAQQPLEAPSPPEPVDAEPSMENFVNAVWDMPNLKKLSLTKEKKKVIHEKAMAEYNRMQRIREKTSATLIICPLSTIVSWEDQLKDHWGGEVTVTGGVGSGPLPGVVATIANGDAPTETVMELDTKAAVASAQPSPRPSPAPSHKRGRPLRVYVYHGASRKLDPHFIAQFDIVITTYSTLSSEYSKQCRGNNPDGDDDDGISSDSGIVELDEDGNIVSRKKQKSTRRKRAFTPGDICSPLQAIYWFRVVLDEAQ